MEVQALDLADLASVHRFAAAVSSRWQELNLLINNAGVDSASVRRTADGFELVFGTNHLGHFAHGSPTHRAPGTWGRYNGD